MVPLTHTSFRTLHSGCECTVCSKVIGINRKNGTFSRIYSCHNIHLLALSQTFIYTLYLPFSILQRVKSLPFGTREALTRAKPPWVSGYGEYPLSGTCTPLWDSMRLYFFYNRANEGRSSLIYRLGWLSTRNLENLVEKEKTTSTTVSLFNLDITCINTCSMNATHYTRQWK